MFTNFIHTYFVKEFYALHVHSSKEQAAYNLIHLHKNKATIKIKDQHDVSSFEELKKKINKKIPVILSITGTKVVHKVMPNQSNYLEGVLFGKDPDEFYIFEKKNHGKILVSVTRKKELDELLTDLREKGIQVIDMFAGPFALSVYKPLLRDLSTIKTPYLDYNVETNEVITKKEVNPDPVAELEIGDEKIASNNLIAFSGFMQFLDKTGYSTNYEGMAGGLFEEFTYGKAFKLLGGVVLAIFLVLLTASYAMTAIYAGKNAEIQQELTLKNQVTDQINKLKKDKAYKENIIKNSSLGSENFISFYIANLVKTIPDDIVLEELSVFPVQGTIDAKKKIDIEPDRILIKGIAPSNNSVNNWLTVIDSLSWVKKTEVRSYTYVKNNYIFSLKLFL